MGEERELAKTGNLPADPSIPPSDGRRLLLELPSELLEAIAKRIVVFAKPLREATASDTKVPLAMLLVNKQVYSETCTVFQKFNNFVFTTAQFLNRQPPFTLLPQAMRELHLPRRIIFRGEVDPHLLTNARKKEKNAVEQSKAFHKLITVYNLRYLELSEYLYVHFRDEHMKTGSSALTEDYENMLSALLGHADGGLRIQGRFFYNTFQVFGARGRITPNTVIEFLSDLRMKCEEVARSHHCQCTVERVIGNVKVSIGYTAGSITTAQIL